MEQAELFLCIRTSGDQMAFQSVTQPLMKFCLRNPDPLALCASVPEKVYFPLFLTRHPGIWNWAVSSGVEGFPQDTPLPKDPPTMVFLPLTPPAYSFFLPPTDFGWSNLRWVIFPHQLQALDKWLVAWLNAYSFSLQSNSFFQRGSNQVLGLNYGDTHLSLLPPCSVKRGGGQANRGENFSTSNAITRNSRVCSPMLPFPKPESTGLGFLFLNLHCRKDCFLSYLRSTFLSKELGSVLIVIYFLKNTWLGWFLYNLEDGAL